MNQDEKVELEQLKRENDQLRSCIADARYRIEQGRVWSGMGWTLTGLSSNGQQKALDAIDAAPPKATLSQQAEPVAWAYHVTGQRFDRRGVCMAEGDIRETEAAFKAHGCSVKVTPLYEHPAPAQAEPALAFEVEIPSIVATFDGLYLIPIAPLKAGEHLMTVAQHLRIEKQLRAALSAQGGDA